MTGLVWFGMWACHCSVVAEEREQVPSHCPECGFPLLSPVEAGERTDSVVLGYEPADMCGCYLHAGPVFEKDGASTVTPVLTWDDGGTTTDGPGCRAANSDRALPPRAPGVRA